MVPPVSERVWYLVDQFGLIRLDQCRASNEYAADADLAHCRVDYQDHALLNDRVVLLLDAGGFWQVQSDSMAEILFNGVGQTCVFKRRAN